MFVRNFTKILITQITVLTFTFLAGILTARILGPAGKGDFTVMITLVSVLALISGFGVESVITYQVSGRKFDFQSIFSTSVVFGLISALLVAGLFLILNYYFNFFDFPEVDGFIFIVLFILITTPVILIQRYIIGILQGLKEFNYYNLANLFQGLFFFIFLIIILLISQPKIGSILILYIISAALGVILSLVFLVKKIPLTFKFSKECLKGFIEKGKRVYLAVIFSNLMLRPLNVIIMSYFLVSRDIGYYSVAWAVGSLLFFIPSAATAIHFPLVSGMEEEEDRRVVTNRLSRYNISLVVLAGILLGLVSKYLIPLLFGQDFSPAFIILLFLLPGAVFFSLQAPFTSYFYGIGYPRVIYVAPFVAFLAIILLNIILLPRIGVIGASISSTIAYLFHFLIILKSYQRTTGSQLKDLFILKKEEISLNKLISKK
jgi:O-antigen/teichoic acid export membrane protein